MKLIIFSICKDEAETIGELLKRIPKKIPGVDKIETLVVSDGSTDSTADAARRAGATKIIEGVKQKRLAYRFEQAIETALSMDADIAVNIDGDLQFAPEDIPTLLKPILQDGADFVAADRFTDPDTGQRRKPAGMPGGKYWANRLGAWIVGNLSGERFYDVTCGFRAYTKKAMLAININSTYTYTQESFQVLAVKKMNIVAVPIHVKYYEGRKSRVVKSFWQFLFGSALNILRAYRDYAPLKFFGNLGVILIIPGLLLGGFTFVHWIRTDRITPYIAVGALGLYLTTLALVVWALGLVADMLDRLLNNQEKILEAAKRQRFDK
ncbi:MAG TPA: glycosyltransferase family 2 protein [Candidatus Limnocylindria bacterium]|nr:glycosyltransferase family 2 protein [Candidatus Limnocylindria bacterium]